MKSILSVFIVLITHASLSSAQTSRPAPAIERVVIISIDGLRPDVMLRAASPNLRALMAEGSFTCWAQTTTIANTLPSHVSMMTGVPPEKHGVTWNRDPEDGIVRYPTFPTLFELAHDAGYTTALVSGKSKFAALAKPGTVDWAQIDGGAEDADVAERAAALIAAHRPQVLLVHLPGVDKAGHANGWGTPRQVAAVDVADHAVGVVLSAMKQAKVYDGAAIIVTADHGGRAMTHGEGDPRSIHIPWIVVGPGVRKNFDLTIYRDLIVRTEDTFATACAFLGITPAREVDGKPVLSIREDVELLRAVPTGAPSSSSSRPTTAPATNPSRAFQPAGAGGSPWASPFSRMKSVGPSGTPVQ